MEKLDAVVVPGKGKVTAGSRVSEKPLTSCAAAGRHIATRRQAARQALFTMEGPPRGAELRTTGYYRGRATGSIARMVDRKVGTYSSASCAAWTRAATSSGLSAPSPIAVSPE